MSPPLSMPDRFERCFRRLLISGCIMLALIMATWCYVLAHFLVKYW